MIFFLILAFIFYLGKIVGLVWKVLLINFTRYGSWGVCYTYGTWFGITGLVAGGKTYENSYSIRKACDFLLSKQLSSDGWGESYRSCQDKVKSVQVCSFFPLFKELRALMNPVAFKTIANGPSDSYLFVCSSESRYTQILKGTNRIT